MLVLSISCSNILHKNDFLIRVIDEDSYTTGYINMKNDTIIELGKYFPIYTDTFSRIAIVGESKDGIIGIDRNQKKIFNVHVFDNGPDEISEGLFRIFTGKKYGFADMNGIQIKPKYNFVYPFSEGLAAVNLGGIMVDDYLKEHKIITGGKWGFIDKKGRVVIKFNFDFIVQSFQNGIAEVEVGGVRFLINKKGESINVNQ